MMTPSSRKALVVLVALFLVTTAVSAEPRPGARLHPARTVASNPLESFSGFWSLLASFWTKNGCSLDPSGVCLPAKNGCQVDPSGRCLPAATTTLDNGCSLDPDGRCVK
jgi:hypothetical protein